MAWLFHSTQHPTVGLGSSTDSTSLIVSTKHSRPHHSDTVTCYITEAEHNTDIELCQTSVGSWPRRLRKSFPYQPATLDTKSFDGVRRGWRKSMTIAAITTAIVLALNFIFTIIVFFKYETTDGVGIIYQGDCDVVKRWDSALHLLINVLGTALLAASCFTMQCLSSPTRKEIDTAHKNRHSLEIGLLSMKNLLSMRLWKAVFWILLCLTTMPLHLLWNSTIFSTRAANQFSYIMVDKDFLSGAPYTWPEGYNQDTTTYLNNTITMLYHAYLAGNLSELTPEKCLADYVVPLLTNRRNLILVVETPNNNNTAMSPDGFNSRIWNGSCVLGIETDAFSAPLWQDKHGSTPMSIQVITRSITPTSNFTLETCWSEATDQSRCQLQFTTYILWTVLICNFIKLVCIASTTTCLWNLDEPILATVGDAVASFLDRKDDTTYGRCLLDRRNLHTWQCTTPPTVRNSVYNHKSRVRLYSATTATRWWFTMSFCMAYVTVGFIMFGKSMVYPGYPNFAAFSYGFGYRNGGLTLGLEGQWGIKLIRNIVVANSFQLILSITYFAYNSLYTAQCAALEWASYAQGKRKGLRVTWPQDQQLSTYWLHLPYKYSISLTALSMVMHFLVSQSIFLASFQLYDSAGNPVMTRDDSHTDIGYSPEAIMTTCCVGAVLILAQIANALRPLDNHMPIHGNSSAVISAVCHADEDAYDSSYGATKLCGSERSSIATVPIMWGVTRQPVEESSVWLESTAYVPGHCSFSAEVVELPLMNHRYV